MSDGEYVELGNQRCPADVGQIHAFGVVKGCVPRELRLLTLLPVRDQGPGLDLQQITLNPATSAKSNLQSLPPLAVGLVDFVWEEVEVGVAVSPSAATTREAF